jgi:hypothetical protein
MAWGRVPCWDGLATRMGLSEAGSHLGDGLWAIHRVRIYAVCSAVCCAGCGLDRTVGRSVDFWLYMGMDSWLRAASNSAFCVGWGSG